MKRESATPSTQTDADEATRHLCAGVYLDQEFRNSVIRQVHGDSRYRAAPSYGFDLVAVVDHARRAWLLERVCQAGLVVVLATGLITNAAATVMVVCAILTVQQISFALGAVPGVVRLKAKQLTAKLLRRHMDPNDASRLRQNSRVVWLRTAACACLAALSLLASAVLGNALTTTVTAAVAILALIVVMTVTAGVVRQLALNAVFRAESLRPARLGARLAVLDAHQSHPYVVYSLSEQQEDDENPWKLPSLSEIPADPSAFVGSGEMIHRWQPQLVVLLLRPGDDRMPDREYRTPPFRAHELVEYLKEQMAPLATAAGGDKLPGLRIRDRVFIAESDVSDEREFLESGDLPDIVTLIDEPHGHAQHYLELCVAGTGEVVTTVFLRVTVGARALSMDFVACALTPTPSEYHRPGRYKEAGPGAVVRSAVRGLKDLPASLRDLWQLAEVPVVLTRIGWARRDRSLRPRRRGVIGTRLSVREEKSLPLRDIQLERVRIVVFDHMKIMERRLLLAAEDFLKLKNVDTSEFRKRAASIISTTINNAGQMNMTNSVVGNNSAAQWATAANIRLTTAIANAVPGEPRPSGGE